MGDSVDSASNVHVVAAASSSSPKSANDLVNSARKSSNSASKAAGRSEDRLGAGSQATTLMLTPLIESAVAPTLDHEIKGACYYQLENDKTAIEASNNGGGVGAGTSAAAATSDAEIAHS